MASKNTALVLGGGGAAGNAWMIGVIAGLAEAGVDLTEAADLVIGTSSGATAAAHVRSGIPPAELLAEEAPAGAIFATGRSDMPNQINNSLCFPGFFRGALDARATTVTLAMKQAATRAIADIVTDEQRGLGVIIPTMFQARLHQAVAEAVTEAWFGEHPQARRRDGGARLFGNSDGFAMAGIANPMLSDVGSLL